MRSSRPLFTCTSNFTRLASKRVGDRLGGLVVEATVALSILLCLAVLWSGRRWNQKFSGGWIQHSLLTGICVGAGTIAFLLLFQKGGPLSAVPIILAADAAMMAIAGIVFFREPLHGRGLPELFSRSLVYCYCVVNFVAVGANPALTTFTSLVVLRSRVRFF
jgi:transporter family protein